jgi:diguanylate cyclase (GGDEF)-like protein
MELNERRFSSDWVAAISLLSISAFVAILCFVAAKDVDARQPLFVVIVGLGAGGLILFRQLRKTARSLIASEARALYAATHDERTQLPNRALMLDRLVAVAQTQTSGSNRTPAVLCIGLDRFEEVSETLGLGVSDDVVAEIATRLGAICHERDTMARLGDGLFAHIWTGAADGEAEDMALRLVKLVADPCEAAAGQAFITGSVGVCYLTPDLEHPPEALRRAQLALSNARKLGGGRVCTFEPAMDHALKTRKSLERELRRALAEESLTMVYQPQVDGRGTVVGVEALMRWNSAELGPVSPAAFVPLAESCGLSDEVGSFALRRALLDARRWPGLKVAVNVSAAQVRSGGLINLLKNTLAETGAPARNVELEITESVLLADEAETYETLGAARKLGFSLVLDDFGTGYSSLSYLRRFPVDKIKIDRSFVSHLGMRPESTAIIKAIVDLAEALELKVLAEGVETRNQVERLQAVGCNHFQGFLFSAPITPDAIDDLLTRRSRLAA